MPRWWDVVVGLGSGLLAGVGSRAGARATVTFWMGQRWFGVVQFPDPNLRTEYEQWVRYGYIVGGLILIAVALRALLGS